MQSDLRDYLSVLLKRRTLVLFGLITCLVAAGALTYLATPIYEAEAKLFVGQRQIAAARVIEGQTVTQLSSDLLKSYAAILETHPIASVAIRRAHLSADPRQLAAEIEAEPILDTQLISLRYRSPRPEVAQRTVNAVAEAFKSEVQKVEATPFTEQDAPAVQVSVVSPALVPEAPVSPNVGRNIALGIVLGLVLGIALAFLAEQLDTTVKGKEDVESSLELPVLASVPRVRIRTDEIYLEKDRQSAFGETFRKLRTALELYESSTRLRTILVTSPAAKEGKTTTALNLAAMYAYSGSRTVLLEADLRRPQLHALAPTENGDGLARTLLHQIPIDQALVRTEISGLYCLPAGAIPPNPAEMLASPDTSRILEELRQRFDTIIVDAPPVLPVADASTLAARVDGVLLVARAKDTHRSRLKESAQLVHKVGGRVLGVVLNAVPLDASGSDYSYYVYGVAPSRTRRTWRSSRKSAKRVEDLDGGGAPRHDNSDRRNAVSLPSSDLSAADPQQTTQRATGQRGRRSRAKQPPPA